MDGQGQDAGNSPPSSSSQDMEMISRQLQRDAKEQYLFIAEYMHQCGALWSPVIVAMCFYGFYYLIGLTISFVVYSVDESSPSYPNYVAEIGFFVFQTILILGLPFLSLASANAVVAPMTHLFTNSSSDDFNMIGLVMLTNFFKRLNILNALFD